MFNINMYGLSNITLEEVCLAKYIFSYRSSLTQKLRLFDQTDWRLNQYAWAKRKWKLRLFFCHLCSIITILDREKKHEQCILVYSTQCVANAGKEIETYLITFFVIFTWIALRYNVILPIQYINAIYLANAIYFVILPMQGQKGED